MTTAKKSNAAQTKKVANLNSDAATKEKVANSKANDVSDTSKTDAATMESVKALLLAGVSNAKGDTESNIYTFMHLTEDRPLSREERNNSKFMRGYRNKLRTTLEKHFSAFTLMKKNQEIHNIDISLTAALIKQEGTMEAFMTFYKRFYKINDFSPASVANNQRIHKVDVEIKTIAEYWKVIEKSEK